MDCRSPFPADFIDGARSAVPAAAGKRCERGAGSEIFLASFGSFADVLSGNFASASFSQLNIGAGYSVGGLTYDGQYRLLLESDANAAAGSEIFLATFGSFADVLSGNFASASFSQLNIGAGYSVGGLTYDGQYRLLLESDANAAAGSEIFLASFGSFADVLSGNFASASFSQLNIGAGYSVGGLTYDGQYRLLLESDANAGAGSEIFLASFGSFADVLSGNFASASFSQLEHRRRLQRGRVRVRAGSHDARSPNPAPLPCSASASRVSWRRVGANAELQCSAKPRCGGAFHLCLSRTSGTHVAGGEGGSLAARLARAARPCAALQARRASHVDRRHAPGMSLVEPGWVLTHPRPPMQTGPRGARSIGGEGGIRTHGTVKPYTGFRIRRIRPLCHLS